MCIIRENSRGEYSDWLVMISAEPASLAVMAKIGDVYTCDNMNLRKKETGSLGRHTRITPLYYASAK